ncbi:hypothetical protein BELL_1645g00020 [Botrytis elliptica]|uniref:Uncharacterized protein n=1 Tax=Botrytis elliptica TaxID=278938 RepID=A0A4Z1HUD2_9HELO|nr:hypothetical protein BELL_1645g00020 [Botrytis elliptica]
MSFTWSLVEHHFKTWGSSFDHIRLQRFNHHLQFMPHGSNGHIQYAKPYLIQVCYLKWSNTFTYFGIMRIVLLMWLKSTRDLIGVPSSSTQTQI